MKPTTTTTNLAPRRVLEKNYSIEVKYGEIILGMMQSCGVVSQVGGTARGGGFGRKLGGSRDSGSGRLPTLRCFDQAHRLPTESVQQEGVEVVFRDFYATHVGHAETCFRVRYSFQKNGRRSGLLES